MRTLLITGGAGFIGSNFINKYMVEFPDDKIINLDALYYSGNENNIHLEHRQSANYKFIRGNLQNKEIIKQIFNTYSITHVIHFAAQSHVQTSFEDSIQYSYDNVIGTHNLLEMTRLNCKTLEKFIHCSTDEVYGESNIDDTIHKTETCLLCPTNPYAATKAAAEMIVQSYIRSFKLPIIITRGNNVYGPNQYPEKVIPKFIKQLKNNEKVTIQGEGDCKRGFLHSDDTASAFIKILIHGNIGEIYNIGCDENMEYSILDLAKILIKSIKNTDKFDDYITYIEDRPFNDVRYYISNSKLKSLGWNINTKLEEGINKLISKIPIYVYFHICMINNWVSIVKDILNKIKESGLYDIIDQIRCFCLGDKKNFPEDMLDSKMKIHFDSNTNLYERFTLNNLYKDANKEEFICLYLHSKGITRIGNKNVKDWVDYLIHFNISRHNECLQILETNDCVGVNLAKDQIHYSGNFWWSKSSHIKQLNMPIGSKYNDPEFWICTKKENVSYANIYSSNINHYYIPFPENTYKNNEIKLNISRFN
jgi:dTDP-glucose 4,6-dehydratase